MAKRKKSIGPKNDSMIAGIVITLFVAAIVLYVVLSKGKEADHDNVPVQSQPHEVSAPVKIKKHHVYHVYPPIETEPVESEPVESQPVESLPSESNAPEPVENAYSGSGGKIAFIIDDWGQTTANCKYLREIPEPIAVSILPGLRHTKDVANCAQQNHKLAMLHLPLEAFHNGDIYPPNYIIKTSMSPGLIASIVDEDLDQLPSIEGVNNHMGSKATESRYLMKIVFRRIKKRGLFFVDSMTASGTVCAALAQEMGLSFGKRDVFLDTDNTREAITRQIMELAQKAHRRGYAVAIGHDRRLTMQVIKDEIPLLESKGFKIVSIKELIKNR